jgi:predicted RNA-binding protein
MCLSTVYNKTEADENMLLRNVQKITVCGDELVFTDLLEKETRIPGRLVMADLVNGRVIIDTAACS